MRGIAFFLREVDIIATGRSQAVEDRDDPPGYQLHRSPSNRPACWGGLLGAALYEGEGDAGRPPGGRGGRGASGGAEGGGQGREPYLHVLLERVEAETCKLSSFNFDNEI